MSCTAIQSELTALRARRVEQAELVETLPHNAGYELAVDLLAQIVADIASTEAALELCLAQEAQQQNPVPQAILGTVDKITCHDASKEVGKEEPYVLIATFDMNNVVVAGVTVALPPGLNVVKIGPWADVKKGSTRYASELSSSKRQAFWNVSGAGEPIGHPQDVIFLVAMMEHDGSSPDNIRGLVATELATTHLPNIGLTYAAYVNNMISNMTGTIDTSRLVPGQLSINLDDLIDDVKQLSLTTGDLANLNNLVPVTKSLRFTQRKNNRVQNDYTVTFSFTV